MPTPQPAPVPPEVADQESPQPGAPLTSGTSTKLEPPSSSDTGTLIGGTVVAERYRIDRLLGEGGMGKVYAAEHIHMRKHVAVKVLHREMSTTPEIVARFEREAVAAGKIAHPNVAAATDFGRLGNGSFFLVLEYVAGNDLRSVIKNGPVEPGRALRIVAQIVDAIGAAHAAGVVHRDLKPENIMLVERDGDTDFVKVLDFGIAKIDAVGMTDTNADTLHPPSGAAPLTKMGAVFGTPDYMSPEQALGQPIDGRTDLYSVGVMFYELLTGSRPFKGGAVTLMRKHVLEEAPPLPAAIHEAIDPRINSIVQKLLQKSASDRYANAGELTAALNELVTTQPPDLIAPAVTGISGTSEAQAARRSLRDPSFADQPAPPPKKKGRTGTLLLFSIIVGVFGYTYLTGTPVHRLWENVSSILPTPPVAPTTEATAATAATAETEAVSTAPTASGSSSATPVSTDPSAAPVASGGPADSASSAEVTDPEAEPVEDTAPTVSGANAPTTLPTVAPQYHKPPTVHANPGRAPRQPRRPQPPPQPPPARPAPHRTGPGGIYIPPPREWFRDRN